MKYIKKELQKALYYGVENKKISVNEAIEITETCCEKLDCYENIVKCLKKAFKEDLCDFTIENSNNGSITKISSVGDLLAYYGKTR